MTAFRQQVQAYIAANLSPAARSRILADTARQGVADLVSSGQASPVYERWVDGVQDADESQVKGDGTGVIHYQFSYQAAAAVFALGFLMGRAPSRSGEFRQSFYFGVDGRFIPATQFNPDSVAWNSQVVIGNTQPYSRKVDVQLEGNRVLHFSVPSGMFDDCATAVAAKYRGVVQVKRVSNMRFPGQYILRDGTRRGNLVDSPAIVINPVT